MAIERLLLCSCADSQSVDATSAGAATGASDVRVCSALCTTNLTIAEEALAEPGTTLIACAQQARQFETLAQELSAPGSLVTADIRDRAGWGTGKHAHAKQAALLADAVRPTRPTPAFNVQSDGVALVIGGDAALEAAAVLAQTLSVTCLVDSAPDFAAPTDTFDLAMGRVVSLTGALGGFSLKVDGYAPANPAGRGGVSFAAPRNGAKSHCDIVVDLSGRTPLVSAPHKRDGYVRADPRDPAAVARAIREASDLVGEFEKPLYVRFDESLCAHSRAGQTGCTRCLSVCPTGAIISAGDTVSIDPQICAGCGACAAVCPSGAASYDAPPVEDLFARLSGLALSYKKAGGTTPVALFHDAHGAEMIALSARFGAGLPAHVIPVEVANVELAGHAELLAALGVGFDGAVSLTSPKSDVDVIEREVALARAVIGGVGREADRIALISPTEPDELEAALSAMSVKAMDAEPILPMGSRRQTTRLAAQALSTGEGAPIALSEGAPYGSVEINTSACTLCLACVSLCPTGALGDNPDKPQVRFQEAACVQCGICDSACPESAITLQPQLNLSNDAMSHQVLHEEEPFACIECGKLFGVKSTIERIVEKLEGKHWMFKGSNNARLIQMCDDCRVNAQYHQDASPFRMGQKPQVRTTEDELRKRDQIN
ncbi:MAG: 4Fe-4S binding protein [Pseudomonadota bacterium]